jgi:hypothetical protein
LPEAAVDPQSSKLLLHSVERKACAKHVEIDLIKRLVLIEAREDDGFFSGLRVDVALKALSANFLHHALHGRIDAGNAAMIGMEEWLEHRMTGALDGAHHAVGADHDDAALLSAHVD